MKPPRRGTDALGDGRRERNDVVLRGLLDLFDAGDVEGRAGAQVTRRFGGNDAILGHRLRRCELNLQPGLVPALIGPDRAHFR